LGSIPQAYAEDLRPLAGRTRSGDGGEGELLKLRYLGAP